MRDQIIRRLHAEKRAESAHSFASFCRETLAFHSYQASEQLTEVETYKREDLDDALAAIALDESLQSKLDKECHEMGTTQLTAHMDAKMECLKRRRMAARERRFGISNLALDSERCEQAYYETLAGGL